MLSEIRDAEDRDQAVIAIKAFAEANAAKYRKAVAKIVTTPRPFSPSSTSRPSTGST